MEKISLTLFQNTELIALILLCAAAIALTALLYFVFFRNGHFEKNGWNGKDITNAAGLTLLSAVFILWDLGSARFPVTTWQPSAAGQDIVLELTEETHFEGLYLIYGEGDNNALESGYQLGVSGLAVYGSNDAQSWQSVWAPDRGEIYEYQILSCDLDYRYLRLSSVDPHNTITEFAVRAYGEDRFLPLAVKEDAYADSAYPASLIIDEQDLIVIDPTYIDQGYFDEVYHPRNAWEIANGQVMYATVHPLLGTNIMALFIRLFGMSPLVWRLPGALAGIAMVPLLYAVLKILFHDTWLCTFGTALLAFDFMHLTTSRIGTLEPFSLLTILWMVWEMLKYCAMDHFSVPFRKQMLQLLKCGIAMGIAIAVKWTACYSAVALALLLFTRFFAWYRTWKKAKGHTGKYAREVRRLFPGILWKTVAWCFVFFIFIPVIIYWAAYLPDRFMREPWSVSSVWDQTMYIYRYHSTLNATHPFQSSWYEWILDLRPIWYYFHVNSEGLVQSISCYSHPLLAWGGLLAVLMTLASWIDTRDDTAWTILVLYLTALLPWALLVGRCTFSYHFYPASVFTILAIVYAVYLALEDAPHLKGMFNGILILYVILFVAFLPSTAGHATTAGFLHMLEWLSSWRFG